MPRAYKHTNEFINAIGGSDVIIDVLLKKGLLSFFNKILGKRCKRAEYSYGDIIISWFVSICRGAKRFENLYNHKESLVKHPRFKKCMSPDTLSRILKKFSVENIYYKKFRLANKKKIEKATKLFAKQIKGKNQKGFHEVNMNNKMNELLIDNALKTGLLQKGVKYILDYDTTIIETKISDSRKHYKGEGKTGYAPSLACINKIPLLQVS